MPERRQVGGVGEIGERDQVAQTCSLTGVTLPLTDEYLRLLKAGRARKNVPLETLERASSYQHMDFRLITTTTTKIK